MIHGDTSIQYLDILDGDPRYKTIKELYQENIHKQISVISTDYVKKSIINFDSNNIKITDLFGWTDVLEIRKVEYNHPLEVGWLDISVANKKLTISDDELLPVYTINDRRGGFHGEIKYAYTPKYPLRITEDYIRTHNGENDNGEYMEFSLMNILNSYSSKSTGVNHGYEILTRSKFYNANDINIFGYHEFEHKKRNASMYR